MVQQSLNVRTTKLCFLVTCRGIRAATKGNWEQGKIKKVLWGTEKAAADWVLTHRRYRKKKIITAAELS